MFATLNRCCCHDGGVAQSEEPEDFVAPATPRVRAGTLLLANTDLLEPTFRRSVIYVVEHNDAGTLGVVLNRPSETAVYNVLPQWAKLATKPKTMFIGGPVKRDAALCLATVRVGNDPSGVAGLRHVQGRMVMVDLDADPVVTGAASPSAAGFAAGHSPDRHQPQLNSVAGQRAGPARAAAVPLQVPWRVP